jgi:hypothetical protein
MANPQNKQFPNPNENANWELDQDTYNRLTANGVNDATICNAVNGTAGVPLLNENDPGINQLAFYPFKVNPVANNNQ